MAEHEMTPREKQEVQGSEQVRPGRSYVPEVDICETADGLALRADMPGVDPDKVSVELEDGVLTLSGEVHVQRWLSAPELMDADASGTKQEQLTWTAGLRGWWKVGDLKLRPGIAYARGVDDPMGGQSYQIVQVDLPVIF